MSHFRLHSTGVNSITLPLQTQLFCKRVGGSAIQTPGGASRACQTIESISGHTYIRKRISLTFFVKKLILWSEGLC
jgi:hypothetical protein